MSSVVFLRAINVGGGNLCKPAQLAKRLDKFDIVNIGAVGTFVVRGKVDDEALRKEFAVQLAKDFKIKCEIMIAPAAEFMKVATKTSFARQPTGPNITRFMSVLHERPKKLPRLPLNLPSDKKWLLRIITIRNQFVIGLYRREMKAIGYLGKIEKILAMPATTRSWTTIEKIVKILKEKAET